MFAEEFVDAYQRYILEYLREHHLGDALPNVKLEPLSKEASIAGQATATDEPADQTDGVPQKQPDAVLDDIADHSGLNELVDFDDLEAQSDTVVFDDDAGQVKG
jgi:hypothetical protein